MPAIEKRYQPTYRHDEIRLIYDFALRGESLCFVGVAGVGKSNVINFLRQSHQTSASAHPGNPGLLFSIADARTWQGTPLSLWRLMDEGLRDAAAGLTPPFQEPTVVPLSDEQRALDRLRARLQWACQELGHRVMFVLDDFDLVFQHGPLAMIDQLNAFRSAGNRGLLSYLVFTKRLPHVLGRSYHLDRESKFFDLIRHSHFALAPYQPHDAQQMLKHLNSTLRSPFTEQDLAPILALAGGHARLIWILFQIWSREGALAVDAAEYLVKKPEVQRECRRILQGLHPQEQEVAVRAARGALHPVRDLETLDHLARRGLLTKHEGDTIEWFSPLMARYLSTYAGQGGD